ncbi:histidine kinase [Pseudomonas maumuensis]|uniref:Histidine kinase n=1 Tax=Pseudomonas maumuensis TaxID=2842354 RepID=A0ABX8NNW1_9PSED|nr:histidine kinase [Pseudomonas maumuensis]QXH57734.1 histidine kinase [Pseudomonas maumuensis]
MHQLNVLIHQARPYHQMLLHQAFNAQGVYNVRLTDDVPAATARLAQGQQPVDVLVLDQGMPRRHARRLFKYLVQASCAGGLLFVGCVDAGGLDLALEARKHGLNVLAELSWPMSMVSLEQALGRLMS